MNEELTLLMLTILESTSKEKTLDKRMIDAAERYKRIKQLAMNINMVLSQYEN